MEDPGDISRAMRGECRPGVPTERAIATLASRQHGVVARSQLLGLGLSDDAIQRRVASARLHRLHRGVYAVGHSAVPVRGSWIAAVLAGGEGAVLSHRSAAALWGFAGSPRIVDVTAPRSRRGRPGIRLHRARLHDPHDITRRDGFPVTSVPRTLLDLADVVRVQELERSFEEADRLRLLDVPALEEMLARSPGRRGLRPLGALLSQARQPVPDTRSELERRFLRLCREGRLPQPAVNALVAGYEVDACWPDRRLVVELDGYAYHRTRAAFERDRARDAVLQRVGCRVIRLTHRMIDEDPAAVVETVRSLLAAA